MHRIFSLCRSKKVSEVKLEDFAFTDNPNNCEYCAFQRLCIERASGSSSRPEDAHEAAVKKKRGRPAVQSSFL
jgi:uncharacterized protein (UPF0179 family)